jgi:ribosome maturation factor RimP
MITKEQIIELANQKINGTHLFLVDVKVLPGNKIEVFVDGDNGMGINECVEISRHIEGSLDRESEDFSLVVSSPDATKPIKLGRQYLKHIGREFDFVLLNGETLSGKLIEADPAGLMKVESTTRENKPVGKGKITVTRIHELQLTNIKESTIKLKF